MFTKNLCCLEIDSKKYLTKLLGYYIIVNQDTVSVIYALH
jgi:hypothetical protein